MEKVCHPTAGLYDLWGGKPCYCILTAAANELMEEVCHRTLLVLHRKQISSWLNDFQTAADILRPPPLRVEKASPNAQIRL